jgi:hypothetical protein
MYPLLLGMCFLFRNHAPHVEQFCLFCWLYGKWRMQVRNGRHICHCV